jgi:Flp pilus assembly pilin Flp
MPMPTLKQIRNNEKGATAVEFAVIAAILFVILFGILEFSILFLQEHFVANAAREGVRIGVRANNYNCFDDEVGCPSGNRVNRKAVVDQKVREYLDSFYDISPAGIVDVSFDDVSTDKKTLSVVVTVPNFYPPILSSLVNLIPGGGFTLPTTISQKATGDYEDPSEP